MRLRSLELGTQRGCRIGRREIHEILAEQFALPAAQQARQCPVHLQNGPGPMDHQSIECRIRQLPGPKLAIFFRLRQPTAIPSLLQPSANHAQCEYQQSQHEKQIGFVNHHQQG